MSRRALAPALVRRGPPASAPLCRAGVVIHLSGEHVRTDRRRVVVPRLRRWHRHRNDAYHLHRHVHSVAVTGNTGHRAGDHGDPYRRRRPHRCRCDSRRHLHHHCHGGPVRSHRWQRGSGNFNKCRQLPGISRRRRQPPRALDRNRHLHPHPRRCPAGRRKPGSSSTTASTAPEQAQTATGTAATRPLREPANRCRPTPTPRTIPNSPRSASRPRSTDPSPP